MDGPRRAERVSEGFPPPRRIRRKRDFDLAYRSGGRASGRFLTAVVRSNELDRARLGLSIGRAAGHAARRNRWKRRLREAFRRNPDLARQGVDIVLGVRNGSEEPSWSELTRELTQVAESARRRQRPARG